MIITAEMLRRAGVHEDEVTQLTLFYGEHVDVTEAWALEHAHDDIDWRRAAEGLLPESARRSYDEAREPARREFDEVTESARRTHNEAMAPVRRAYDEAVAAAGREYEAACAVAFARALNA